MAKEMNEVTEVVENDVLDDVVDSEEYSEEGRDYLKDGLAIGAGLLALDGLYHVGKFAWNKGIKPAGQKVKAGFKNMKEKAAQKKAAKNNPVTQVVEAVEETVK